SASLSSSVKPSLNDPTSLSSVRLTNGSTAMEGKAGLTFPARLLRNESEFQGDRAGTKLSRIPATAAAPAVIAIQRHRAAQRFPNPAGAIKAAVAGRCLNAGT